MKLLKGRDFIKEQYTNKVGQVTDVMNRKSCGLQCYTQALEERCTKDGIKYEIEIEKYKQLNSALENEIESQGKALTELQNKYQSLNTEKSEAERLISAEMDVNAEKSNNICALTCYIRALVEKFKSEKESCSRELRQFIQRNKSLEIQAAEQQNTLSDMQTRYEALNIENEELKSQLVTKMDQHNDEVIDICGLKCYIKAMNDGILKEIDNYKGEIKKYRDRIADLEEEMNQETKLNESRTKKYENHIHQLEEGNQILSNTIEDLRASAQVSTDKDICGLKCYIRKMDTEIMENRNEAERYNQMLNEVLKQKQNVERLEGFRRKNLRII